MALPSGHCRSSKHRAWERGSAGSTDAAPKLPEPREHQPPSREAAGVTKGMSTAKSQSSGFWNETSGSLPVLGPTAAGSWGLSRAASLLLSWLGTKAASLLPPWQRRAPLPAHRDQQPYPPSPTGRMSFTCRALISYPSDIRGGICATGELAWACFGKQAWGAGTHNALARCPGISSLQPLAQVFSMSFPCYP